MGNFLVRYASRVVIYDRRAVIRLATESKQGIPTLEFAYNVYLSFRNYHNW